ncbi:hypothetical protein [Microbulbifer sp. JMSA003]|uniref:hypothetical protein n=1 Tax=Microbulbifer sp. JMSA003 TaxID=3243369 RepID=UPI00403A09B1
MNDILIFLIVPAVFFVAFIFWMVWSVARGGMGQNLDEIAKKIGIKSSVEFFSDIEKRFSFTEGRLISSKVVHKTVVATHGAGFFNSYYYNLELSVVFYVKGERYSCEKSVFSMINNKDEGRADRALSLIRKAKNISVYYDSDDVNESYVIFDGVKDWSSV